MKIDENQPLQATLESLEKIGRQGTPHLGFQSTTSVKGSGELISLGEHGKKLKGLLLSL